MYISIEAFQELLRNKTIKVNGNLTDKVNLSNFWGIKFVTKSESYFQWEDCSRYLIKNLVVCKHCSQHYVFVVEICL